MVILCVHVLCVSWCLRTCYLAGVDLDRGGGGGVDLCLSSLCVPLARHIAKIGSRNF